MRLTSVRLPGGEKPKFDHAVVLNVGIAVVPEFEVEAHEEVDAEDAPFADVVHMKLRFDQYQGRYVVTFLGLESVDVTSTSLREVRVGELLRMASTAGIFVKVDRDEPPVSVRDWLGEDLYIAAGSPMGEMVKKTGPNGWVLNLVSLVYNIAQISSQAPAKAVERAFGLSARTAARWIAKAREQGILIRPALPGYEEMTARHDRLKEAIERGEEVVRVMTMEDIDKLLHERGNKDHGEHQAEA